MPPTPLPAGDDLLILQLASSQLLAAAVRGDIDLNELARRALAARGLDLDGNWIGFDASACLLGVAPGPRSEAV